MSCGPGTAFGTFEACKPDGTAGFPNPPTHWLESVAKGNYYWCALASWILDPQTSRSCRQGHPLWMTFPCLLSGTGGDGASYGWSATCDGATSTAHSHLGNNKAYQKNWKGSKSSIIKWKWCIQDRSPLGRKSLLRKSLTCLCPPPYHKRMKEKETSLSLNSH